MKLSDWRISVIIPTYNRIYFLKRALDSVLQQTYPAAEILVIDDGSEDDTALHVQQSYPQVKYYRQSNQGVSKARNAGIMRAEGEWIAFLDSDDAWHPDKLKRQIQALQQNPDYAVCHTNETWFRHGKFVNPMKKHEKSGGWIFQQCLPLCLISPSSVIIHRSIFQAVGYFDEALPACEDYDLWLRISCRYPIWYLQDKLIIKYGGHSDQLSRKYWGMDRFRIQALLKLIQGKQISGENLAAAISMLKYKAEIYMQGAAKRGKSEEVDYYAGIIEKYTDAGTA